jgi:hypothetical protein
VRRPRSSVARHEQLRIQIASRDLPTATFTHMAVRWDDETRGSGSHPWFRGGESILWEGRPAWRGVVVRQELTATVLGIATLLIFEEVHLIDLTVFSFTGALTVVLNLVGAIRRADRRTGGLYVLTNNRALIVRPSDKADVEAPIATSKLKLRVNRDSTLTMKWGMGPTSLPTRVARTLRLTPSRLVFDHISDFQPMIDQVRLVRARAGVSTPAPD